MASGAGRTASTGGLCGSAVDATVGAAVADGGSDAGDAPRGFAAMEAVGAGSVRVAGTTFGTLAASLVSLIPLRTAAPLG